MVTEYVAKSTMELKDVNMCLSFVSTVWRNKPVLIVFDNLNNNIVTSYFDPVYQEGDIQVLERLVSNFLK
jgi:hypothetical protein